MSYIYQGMSEDVINLTYYFVGIPEGYRDEDGKVIDAEYAFIKAIRPYLLYTNDPEHTLIVFGENCIENLNDYNLLKEKYIKVKSIKELQ